MTRIRVYDALCGSGKTQRIIEEIKNSSVCDRFIYITPLLSECHRVAGTYYEPTDTLKRPVIVDAEESVLYDYLSDAPLKNRCFKHPHFTKNCNKGESLEFLVNADDNIVTTHQLFLNLTPDMLVKASRYTLIIDETLTVYDVFDDYSQKEIEQMFTLGWVFLDADGITLRFNRSNFGLNGGSTEYTKYDTFSSMCDLGQLLYIDNKIIVWELSVDTLKKFREVWIATYLFEGSQLSAYLKNHGMDYELYKFGRSPTEIKHLINLEEDAKLNAIGDKESALSVNGLKQDKTAVTQLTANLHNYFHNKVKAKAKDRMWTCYKNNRTQIGNKRYTKDWLAFNTKATNDYGHINNVAYLINLYPNPMLIKAAAIKGNNIDKDIFALSEMVQFIWRSAIRNEKPINLYIPSKRMRRLVNDWLDGKYDNISHTT